ncbi:hypothetical protein CLOM_g6051 [Closterium sp. NIES-68]|nr:hypothetical protein CLOM_g6051 [Closterium sp. NIES-68]
MVTSTTTAEDIAKLCEAVPPDLAELIRKYPEIFPDDLPAELPPSRPEDHRIELEPGAQSTVQRQFRLSQLELEDLQQQLDYLLTKGSIRPSTSPYAAPILFTPKKDGGFRMCIDYRALNRSTIKSRYTIPRADELLDQLRGAKFFSKIDLRGGYHQIRVAAKDCHKTAFRTRYGSYEYLVMPFGLTNAPLTVQMTMNGIFRELLDKYVIIYLDDILIYSRSREQHLQDLNAVFTLLHKNRLITKGSRCDFLKQELEFLGHRHRHRCIRVLLHHMPDHEILPSVSSRTTTAVGSARATLATHHDGLCDRTASRSQRKRRHPRGLRPTHENGALHRLPTDNYSRANCPTVHRQHHSTEPTTYRNYFRPRPNFTSNFWRHLWDQFGTKLQISSTYHPQTDEQTERVNQIMVQLIQTTCTDQQTWEKSLPLLEFAYNNAPSATTHQSPFFLNYGQDPPRKLGGEKLAGVKTVGSKAATIADVITPKAAAGM